MQADKLRFNIKKLNKTDFESWIRMGKKLWPDNRTLEADFQEILKSFKETVFICKANSGKPVGFINVSIRTDYVEGSSSSPVGYVEGIFVEARFRGKGIAKMLERKGEVWAAKKGCKEIGSDTELRNKKSQRFHKAIGFKEAERLVAFIKRIAD